MRARAERFLKDTCVIEFPGQRTDFDPDPAPTYSAPIPCRKQLLFQRPQEHEAAGEVTAITAWAFLVPIGTQVGPADVILHGGNRFEVVTTSQGATDHTLLSITVKSVE